MTTAPWPRRTLLIAGIAAAIVAAVVVVAVTHRSRTHGAATSSTSTLPPASGAERIRNAGGQIEVDVPTTWTDRDPAVSSTGAPRLRASTTLAEFTAGTYRQPGVELVAVDDTVFDPNDLDAALDSLVTADRPGGPLGTVCTRGERTDLAPDGPDLDLARVERLRACNGGGDVLLTAATDPGQTFTLLVELHVGIPPDNAGVDDVVSSFDVVSFP